MDEAADNAALFFQDDDAGDEFSSASDASPGPASQERPSGASHNSQSEEDGSYEAQDEGYDVVMRPDGAIRALLSCIASNARGDIAFCGEKSNHLEQVRLAQTMHDYVCRIERQIEECMRFENTLNAGLLLCTNVLRSKQQHNFLVSAALLPDAAPSSSASAQQQQQQHVAAGIFQHRHPFYASDDLRASVAQQPNYLEMAKALRTINSSAEQQACRESPGKRTRVLSEQETEHAVKRARGTATEPQAQPATGSAAAADVAAPASDILVQQLRKGIADCCVSNDEVDATITTLESYHAALSNKNLHTTVFSAYRLELQNRLEDVKRLRAAFTETARFSYRRILEGRIRDSKHCIMAKADAAEQLCSICCEKNPRCGLSVDDCSCGPIGHAECLLDMCWAQRVSDNPVRCPTCRAKFSEHHIRKVIFDNVSAQAPATVYTD